MVSGFTLVELLIVMLIIGILAGIAMPGFYNQRNKAHDAGAKELARAAQTAIESTVPPDCTERRRTTRTHPACSYPAPQSADTP
jgi:prepilin-type N-terminal cleavage/methylation domain-containing protein